MPSLAAERSAGAGGVILLLRFAAAAALNYAFGVALAWLLVPASFGAVSALQSVLLLAAGMLSAGLPWALAVDIAQRGDGTADAGRFRVAVLGNIAMSLLLADLLVGARLAGLQVVPGQSVLVVLTIAATLPFLAVNTVLVGALQGARRFGGLGAMQGGEILVKCLVGLVLVVLLGAGVEGVALGFLAGSLAGTAIGVRSLKGMLPGSGPLAPLRTMASALPIWTGTVCFTVLLTADVLGLSVLGHRHGVTAAGLAAYQVCAILARAPFYVSDALVDAVFPFMARRDARAASHGWFLAALRWVPLVILPVQLALLLAPAPLLRLLFPSFYASTELLLRVITVGTLGLLLTNALVKALYALGRAADVARRMPWPVAVELVTMAVLVPSHGAAGAATAYALGAWSAVLVLAPAYLREQQVGLLPTAATVRYLLALLPSAALLLLANVEPDPYSWLLIVLALGVFAALAYHTGLLTTGDLAWVRERLDVRGSRRLLPPATRPPQAAAPLADGGRYPPLHAVHGGRSGGRRVGREWLVLASCGLLGAVATLSLVFRSPDTVYDETVYTQAAHNVATAGQLGWTGQPMFVHPPVSFLLQAGWLFVTGKASAPLLDALHAARILSAATGALNVTLLALLTYRLAEHAPERRRRLLCVAVALLATLDPVLLRYSRLAVIEPFALCLCLLTLLLAWSLRGRSTLTHVSGVGLSTGLALLTKEISVFLILVPVLFALLERDRPLLARSAGAFAAGMGLWLLFPLWAAQLGLFGSFVDIQTATLRRLLGLVQITGYNQPDVSFTGALLRSASQYASSYAVLAAGAVALCWLWSRHHTAAGNFLTAWLSMSYAFAAYIVAVGTLNEQFFVYVLPAAVVGSVLLVDRMLCRRRRASLPWRAPLLAGSAAAAGGALLVLSGTSWVSQYAGESNAVARVTGVVATSLPPCSLVNSSGDPEKYAYLLGPGRLTSYEQGPAALSHGVHYFLLSPHDAVARYGNMSPALAHWITTNGQRLASFPSRTYQQLQLWRVDSSPWDPLSDVEYVPGGLYVNTFGSRCGGFTVTDGPRGEFFTGLRALGGKGRVGAPVSRVVPTALGTVQAFDGVVLRTSLLGAGRTAIAVPMVADLARRAPDLYRAYGLPPLAALPVGSDDRRSAWLTDPYLTRTYLGGGAPPTPASLAVARQRFGKPLGPPVTAADGTVRQPFAGVVLERRAGDGAVRLAPAGRAAVAAGIIRLPASALRAQPPPPLPSAAGPTQRRTVLPFVASLAATLAVAALAVVLVRRRRPRRAEPEAAARRVEGTVA